MSDQEEKKPFKRLKRNSDENRIRSESDLVKKPKIKENSLMYGIDFYNFESMPEALCAILKSRSERTFVPKLKQGHRGIAVFIFDSEIKRNDELIQDFLKMDHILKWLNFSVDYEANIEKNLDDNLGLLNSAFEDFISDELILDSSDNKKKHLSTLDSLAAKIYFNSVILFQKLESEISNGFEIYTDNLCLLIIQEALVFIIANSKILEGGKMVSELNKLIRLRFYYLKSKLKKYNIETQVLFFDLIYNSFSSSFGIVDSLTSLGLIMHFLVDRKNEAKKLIENIYPGNQLKNILLCDRIQNAFKLETPEFFENFEQEVDIAISKACIFKFTGLNISGILTLNKNVIINTAPSCFNEENAVGYYAVVMLHELAHLALRFKCKTAKEYLGYETDENAFLAKYSKTHDLTEVRNKLQRERGQKKEAGFQIEVSVLGQMLSKLNSLAAQFLSISSNWNRSDFQETLNIENSKTHDDDGNEVKSTRMRTICSESDTIIGRCNISMRREVLREHK